jgi:hypothetical protein
MRPASGLGLGLFVVVASGLPSVASASPFGAPLTLHARAAAAAAAQPETGDTPQPTSSKAPVTADPQPTSSRAPESGEIPEAEPQPEPEPEPVPDESVTLESERESTAERVAAKDNPFHRHGIGVRGGITNIPTWILSRWLETHSNSLCRGDGVGNFAAERGNIRTDGCNFYIGGEYTYRFSRIFDLTTSVGYQRVYAPPAYWLDNGQYDGTPASLGGADFTEIDMHLMFMEVDFIARAPIVVTKDFELGIGGGAGIGLGVLFGGVYQTPLGSNPWGFDPATGDVDFASCQSVSDLKNTQRCTPRWDAGEDGDQVPPDENDLDTPNPNLFATCDGKDCSKGDLSAFGYRQKQGGVPPVIPVVNLILSARFLIKDAFGISINGGFNTGFYFGGSLMYFFGPTKQDDMGIGPADGTARRGHRRQMARRRGFAGGLAQR